MQPQMRPTSTPFHQIGEYAFQDMCRDLFEEEPGIATCAVYGKRGERQDGIDLLAHQRGGGGIEVGQCKCYEKFQPKDIVRASDEFLKHWERWSQEGVRRFVLFVACDLNRRKQQDTILQEKKRFASKGIPYEAWSAATIRRKLQPHPEIVLNYCGPGADHWVKVICGSPPPASSSIDRSGGQRSTVSMILEGQLEQLAARVSDDTAEQLETMRAAWREGRRDDVVTWLRHVQGDSTAWAALAPAVKARLLRFAANLELEMTGDVGRAKELVQQARSVAPEQDHALLDALIAYREAGPKAGLDRLQGRKDIDAVNLRAAFLLEMGRLEQAQQSLEVDETGVEANAETLRLRAQSYLCAKELSQARTEVQRALQRQPGWESIRLTAAMVDYLSALSPAVLPNGIVAWPEPVDWAFVKRDDDSLTHLRRAAVVFAELAGHAAEQAEKRRNLQGWKLACLANDPERLDEAADYCRALLDTDPTDYRAVVWATARSLNLSLRASEAALLKLVEERRATISHVLALVAIYVAAEGVEEALGLLDDTKPLFQRTGEEALWTAWYAQLLAARGKTRDAKASLDAAERLNGLELARVGVLVQEARKTCDYVGAVQQLEDLKTTGNSRILFHACELMALQGDWAYVADRSTQLVGEVATASALRLAAIAAYNAKRYGLCLRLLDSHRDFYPQGRLPGDLRCLHAISLQAEGRLQEATTEAEALAREEPKTQNLLMLASLHFEKGDRKRFASVARELKGRPDLSVEDSLGLARAVHTEDSQLAASMWKEAERRGIPDEHVGMALAEAFRLGLDKELERLTQRVGGLAREGRGGVRAVAMDDIVKAAMQQREQITELNKLYRQGAIPIHLLAEQCGLPLAHLYHRMLSESEAAADPARQPALFIRHGGRAPVAELPASDAQLRLHVDVTAVLLAHHLGVLKLVEGSCGPVFIPRSLVPALLEMRDAQRPSQPSQLEVYREMSDLARLGLLRTMQCDAPTPCRSSSVADHLGSRWASLYSRARGENGYILCFLPLERLGQIRESFCLTEEVREYVVNCRAIVDALRARGPLSATEYDSALKNLGAEGGLDLSEVLPQPGRPVFCYPGTAAVLAGAGVLNTACSRFQLFIDERELHEVQAVLQEREQSSRLEDWLVGLVDHLREGIDHGRYRLMPVPSEDKTAQMSASPDPAVACLRSLLSYGSTDGDVIWADDRFVNGYASTGRAPTIGISEMLKALVRAGLLSADEYYSRLSRLRASNARFAPLATDEILHHLKQARIEDGRLVETRELCVLRRYLAACILDGAVFQHPSDAENVPNRLGEVPFLVESSRAVGAALSAVWADECEAEEACLARSEWLVSNLYLHLVAFFRIAGVPTASPNDQDLIGLSLAGLVTQAMGLPSEVREGERSARRRYLDWLHARILRRCFEGEPRLQQTVAGHLANLFGRLLRDAPSADEAQVVAMVLQEFHRDLPKPLRREIDRDAGFLESIGLKRVVDLDGLRFEYDEFWRAASRAVGGQGTKIRAIESDTEVIFEPLGHRCETYGFRFSSPVRQGTGMVQADDLALLSETVATREDALRRNRHWFDCPDDVFEGAVSEIVRKEPAQERMDAVGRWQELNASSYYEQLYQRLRQSGHFDADDLLPASVESLLWHFRIRSSAGRGEAFLTALNDEAVALTRTETLASAIRRFSGLPVPLPAGLVQCVAELPAQDRRALLKQLLRFAGSPLSRIHLAHLLLHCDRETPAYPRLARRVIAELFSSEGREQLDAFAAILEWANGAFNQWPETSSWQPHIRLAMTWAHTHELYAIFNALGVPARWLRDTFRRTSRPTVLEMFTSDRKAWFDVSHPRHLNHARFLLAGTAYAVGERAPCVVDQHLQDLFIAQACIESGDSRFPSLLMMRDMSRAHNELASFLGWDRGESLTPLLGAEIASALSVPALQALCGRVIDGLSGESDQAVAWALCQTLLGDLPPAQQWAQQLRVAINETDFVALFDVDPGAGCAALHTASLQAVHVGDEALCRRLEDQILEVAGLVPGRATTDTEGGMPNNAPQQTWLLLLVESALNLAVSLRSEDTVAEFARILARLFDTLRDTPWIADMIRSFAQALSEALPAAQSLWPLVAQSRAVL